jgi:hypothetical protein
MSCSNQDDFIETYRNPYERSQMDYSNGTFWDKKGQDNWQNILDEAVQGYEGLNEVDLDELITIDDGPTDEDIAFQKKYKEYERLVEESREDFIHGKQFDYDFNWFNESEKTPQKNWTKLYNRQAKYIQDEVSKARLSGAYTGEFLPDDRGLNEADPLQSIGITNSKGQGLAGNIYPGRGISLADLSTFSEVNMVPTSAQTNTGVKKQTKTKGKESFGYYGY